MKLFRRQSDPRNLCSRGFVCGLLLASFGLHAESLRLTSWNLSPSTALPTPTNIVGSAASVLQQLQPDIILLQGMRDWRMCAQLADALKPAEFHILLCSAFRAPADYSCQVAVLARNKGYFSWSEPWQTHPATDPGGFGFVALQTGNYRLGLITAALNDSEPAGAASQLLHELDSVRNWQMNQPQTFVIAGSTERRTNGTSGSVPKLQALENAGFIDALLQATSTNTQSEATASEYFLVQSTSFPLRTKTVAVEGFRHALVSSDLEVDPARAALAWKAWAEEKQAQALARFAQESAQAQRLAEANRLAANHASSAVAQGGFRIAFSWWLAAILGGALTLLPFSWLLARRRPALRAPSALLPEQAQSPVLAASAYTVVLAPPPPTGTSAEAASGSVPMRPTLQLDLPGKTQTQSVLWQTRALQAEAQLRHTQASLLGRLLPNLRRWLKTKLLQKLISDRAKLLDTQHVATHKAGKVEQRLARLEYEIKQQNRAYEQRIEELTSELTTAKEENRELIRERIAQVKAEMAAAQARLRKQARGGADVP